MTQKLFPAVAAILIVLAGPAALIAVEEAPAEQVILLEEVVVHPDRMGDYERSLAELKEAAAAHDFDFGWQTYSTDDLRYVLLWRIAGVAGIDELLAAWEKFQERWGAESAAAGARAFATMDHRRFSVWVPRPDLSYAPEVEADDHDYVVWAVIPAKPGHEQAVEELLAAYTAAFVEAEYEHSWQAAEGHIGTEIPVYSFLEWASSAGAYWMRHDRTGENEALAHASAVLWENLAPHIRGFEIISGRHRPELSYRPENEPVPEPTE